MPASTRFERGDLVALSCLLGTALVIAFPILRGGYLTYIDNSVHLAEVYALANGGSGWSEIGFTGFPLPTLHSPLWYPLLARLVRAGVPLGPMYATALFAGFVAIPLSFYHVARGHLNAPRAGLLAYLLLVQSPMIWGIGSPLGGMWTYGLANGALIVAVDLLSRPALTERQHVGLALILALATLTHLFVLPVLALAAVVTTFVHRRALTRHELSRRALSALVGGLASADYWLTFLWVGNGDPAPLKPFSLQALLCRLLLPSDAMLLLDDHLQDAIRRDLHFTDSIPMVALVLLGVAGFVFARSRRSPLSMSGFWIATLLFGMLVLHHTYPLWFLGPVSWRFLDWVRIGFALSAIPVVAALPSPRSPRVAAALATAFALCGTLLGAWWVLPLAKDSPRSVRDELARLEPLWAWLRTNARADWGRIYVEDTLGADWKAGGLSQSHVLALTAHAIDRPVLGTYYGVVPYKLRWSCSEFGTLFSAPRPGKAWILEAMEKTNAGVLVTSNGEMAERIDGTGAFDRLHDESHYAVFRRRGAENLPIASLTPTNHVGPVAFRPGEMRFHLRTDYGGTRVLAKTNFHAWWHLEGIPGGWLRESPEGFLVIDGISKGSFDVHIWYAPSRIPGLVTVLGFGLLAFWGLRSMRSGPRLRDAEPS